MVEQIVEVRTYVLTLDEDEAKALRAVMGRIGGTPTSTRRRFTDAVSRALDSQGVEVGESLDHLQGSLMFGR